MMFITIHNRGKVREKEEGGRGEKEDEGMEGGRKKKKKKKKSSYPIARSPRSHFC